MGITRTSRGWTYEVPVFLAFLCSLLSASLSAGMTWVKYMVLIGILDYWKLILVRFSFLFFKQKLELAQQSNLSLKLSIIIVIFGKVVDAENTFLIHSFFPSFS